VSAGGVQGPGRRGLRAGPAAEPLPDRLLSRYRTGCWTATGPAA